MLPSKTRLGTKKYLSYQSKFLFGPQNLLQDFGGNSGTTLRCETNDAWFVLRKGITMLCFKHVGKLYYPKR